MDRTIVAAMGVVLALGPLSAVPAWAQAPAPTLGTINATAHVDADGTLHAQYDLTPASPGSSMVFVLPLRVRVDGDPDAWQLLHHDTLAIRGPGGPVAFTATTTDDAITVRVPALPDKPVPVTITLDTRGAASAERVSWELATFDPRPARTTMTLRGPGPITAVDCLQLPSRTSCARTTNQSGAAANAEIDGNMVGQHARLDVTFADGALVRDSRTLVERLTPRTWLRHWWPALALGLAAAGGAAWGLRRRTR